MLKKKKVLNLYAGIGGNRKLWGDEYDITAVELDPTLAQVYKDNFKKDNVVVADAHEYLLNHYKEFDFIWSSPPCQTHSSFRFNINVRFRGTPPKYPDMTLYQEIIFLQHHAKGKWAVENVKPYYTPPIKGQMLQRHLFWSNFDIKPIDVEKDMIRSAQIPDLQAKHGYDLSGYKIPNKRQVLRNCVAPEIGLHVIEEAFRSKK